MIKGAAWAVGIVLLSVPTDPETARVFACRHRHPAPGLHSTLDVAEHPRGATALVEVCNATSSALRVRPRPSLEWDGELVPPSLGRAEGAPIALPPGMTLRFDVELTEHYELRPREYYQCRYAATIDGVETRSTYVGFRVRLTD